MVDLKVYSRNQKYRMQLSSKISDPTGTILAPPGCHTMTRRELLRAMVTLVEPDDTAVWVQGRAPQPTRPTRKRECPSTRPSSLQTGCLAGGTDEARVRTLTELLRKKGDHVTSVVRTEMDDDLNGWAVCRQSGPLLCLVSIGRVHASNNASIDILDGHAYLRCYRELCPGELYLGVITANTVEVLSADEASTYIGHSVWKEFDTGWFPGTVVAYHAAESLFEVLYTDGDQEDMTLSELLQHTKPPEPARQPVDSQAPEWSSISDTLVAVLAINLEHQVALARFRPPLFAKTESIATMSDNALAPS
eukprot:2568878-Rhodomonas_salina.1